MSKRSRKTILLATDQQSSVLNAIDMDRPYPLVYSPYGHRPAANGLLSLIGFNGELPDPLTGHYHLGNGYRQFNPVLMRFNSPDSWSPFRAGGLNAYVYCFGEPVLKRDPTGHMPFKGLMKAIKKDLGIKPKGKSKQLAKADPEPTTNLYRPANQPNRSKLISHPDDIKGSANHKQWLESQETNRKKIQAIKSTDEPLSEPHSSKHLYKNQGTNSEPSLDDYLKTVPDEKLDLVYKELIEWTRDARFPSELKILQAMENESLIRAIRRSS